MIPYAAGVIVPLALTLLVRNAKKDEKRGVMTSVESQIGHKSEERVAILADTREEWFIALQGCFMRNVTVVTIYSSLGEEALCHSLNEICSLCSWQPTNKK
ncbi:hypothetical protein Bca52824_001110 [Brassica carinata]|uniref:AMP-dependent synthetase/ligase domain-containing protein n=1 Tax=Brassica carinata TaxID=52824 RepID=A0A8X7WIR6_BRACI|nr:hypothetical protein Bca52824_001110 [Brassica carinata]